jgi:O-antigen/teichoic acid export membrane protein
VILVLALQGLGAWAMVWGYLVTSAAVGAMGIVTAPVRFGYGFRWEQAKRLTSFGMSLTGASLLVFLMLNVDYLVVGPLLGATQLGVYLFAFNLCVWPVTLISSAIRRVSFAGFSRANNDSSTAGDSFVVSSGLVMLDAAPACLILGALARPLIIVVYGVKWAPSTSVLSLLCVMALVRIMGELTYDYLVAMGRSVAVLCLQGVWVVALIPALYLGAWVGGIKGVGAGHAVIAVAVIVPLMLVLVGQSNVSAKGLWLSWRGPLLASVASGTAGLAASSGGAGVLNLLLGGLAAVLTYVLLMRRRLVTLAHSMRERSPS